MGMLCILIIDINNNILYFITLKYLNNQNISI